MVTDNFRNVFRNKSGVNGTHGHIVMSLLVNVLEVPLVLVVHHIVLAHSTKKK